MTQPVSPFGMPTPGVQPPSAFGLPPPPAPVQPGQQSGRPPPIDFAAIQAQEAARAEQEAAKAKAQSDQATYDAAKLEALRAEHGAFGSAATSFFRGGLDALLVPGALLGAGAETVGNLYQVKALEDFGRDFGEASTGKTAMEALAFVFGGGFGEDKKQGLTYADRSNRILAEQAEARPTLTTLSRLAGTAAAGMGIGAQAAGHAGAAQMLGVNVLEGAGAGAQVAYDESAPLRDVLTSAAIGGTIGAVVTGAGEGISALARRGGPDLSKVFGVSKLQEKADKLTISSVVGKDPGVWNQLIDDPARIQRVAGRMRDLKKWDADEVVGALDTKAAESLAAESTMARSFDEAATAGSLQKIDGLIGSYKSSGLGEMRAIGDQLERQFAPLRASLTAEVADEAFETAGGLPIMRTVTREPNFEELAKFRRELNISPKLEKGVTDPAADAQRSLFRLISGELDSAAKARGPTYAQLWQETSQAADDFQIVSRAMERDLAKRAGSPLIPGSELRSAVVTALLTGVTAANPIAAIGGLLGGAILHKGINALGGAAISKLSNSFARMGQRIPLRVAGGKQMQEVLTELAKTKAFSAKLVESAGANPVAREQAEELARNIATNQILKRAGKLDLDAWADTRITPMQKVLYRGQLLDKVSQDVATVAERTMALHPGLPEVLDPARLAKLTKDADGPAAIGLLSSKLSEVASGIPPTPTGEAAGVALRRAAIDLERADVAQAMAKGHSVANWLDEAADNALDEPTKDFIKNAAKAIRGEIGGENFGEAGRQYRALVDAPAALEQMANQAKLREALRGLDGHGLLPQALKEAQDQVARAYDAAAKLAGLPRPKTLGKDFEAAEHIFHAAEEALTLDGKAMHRVFETAQHAGIHEAAHPHAEANEMTVADAVDGELDNLVPVIRDAASAGSPKYYRPDKAASNLTPRLPPTLEESREIYKEHFDQLKNFQTAMAGAQEGQHPIIAAEANEKIANLIRDIPKPPTTPLGMSSPDMLSNDDLRLARAMVEATIDPGSVIRDFAAGDLDPDKASYAWKQYPGFQRAAQAGLVDMLSNDLTPEERDMIPENLLTQLDATFGFGGALQETSDPFFAARMSEVYRTPQEKRPPPQPNGVLKLVAAKPSFTERIANG